MQPKTTIKTRYQTPLSEETNGRPIHRSFPSPPSSDVLASPIEDMKAKRAAKQQLFGLNENTPPRRQYPILVPRRRSRSLSDQISTSKQVESPDQSAGWPTSDEGLPDASQDVSGQPSPCRSTPHHNYSPIYVKTPGLSTDEEIQLSPELWLPALPNSPETIPREAWSPTNYHPRTPGFSPASNQQGSSKAALSPASKELGRLAWGSPFFPRTPRRATSRVETGPARDAWETPRAFMRDSDGRVGRRSVPSGSVNIHDDITEWVQQQLELAVEAQEADRR
ncbi:hypothetical protein FRC04_003706 [Tulasnella sp. 424]|nr:hypothetical protein FRC04_003706 [Tulasnella sp. 424]KAG8977036.1 hypothetical protein FRC05_002556 [Tulasnella sp. 425]